MHPMVTWSKLKNNTNLACKAAIQAPPPKPKAWKSALKNPLWELPWTTLQALHHNKMWSLVPRPKNVIIIGCKWVYKIKYTEWGTIDRWKARLTAKGFIQVSLVDFEENFSPVIKRTTIRLVLAFIVNFGGF